MNFAMHLSTSTIRIQPGNFNFSRVLGALGALALALMLTACGSDVSLDASSPQELALQRAANLPQADASELTNAQAQSFLQAAVGTRNTSTSATGSTSLRADELFGWAERNYPTLFPEGQTTNTWDVFLYRFYPTSAESSSGVYLGVSNGRVFLLGDSLTNGQILDVGAIDDFLGPVRGPLSVNDILVDRVSFGLPAVFRLAGNNFDTQNFDISIAQGRCINLSQVASSPSNIFVRCTPLATGPLRLQVKTSAGKVLFEKSFVVPSPRVLMQTNLGALTIELLPEAAPTTVINFLNYVHAGFYSSTIFHRLEQGFVLQGGLYNASLQPRGTPGDPIALESNNGLKNLKGTIAMARTSEPNSATSQFYFNLQDNPGLDFVSNVSLGYAVFGRIHEGLFLLDLFNSIQTVAREGFPSVPSFPLAIEFAAQIQ